MVGEIIYTKTYLCLMVVTVSAATFVVMSLAADSKPFHTVANPSQKNKKKQSTVSLLITFFLLFFFITK